MELSVIVPVHNEQGNIQPLLDEIRDALEGKYAYEVLYVDDGSSDSSLNELKSAKANGFNQLVIVQHRGCFGQSAAIQSGAKLARGEWIATLDGDGQNDPADIPALLEKAKQQHERDRHCVCVAGYRVKRDDSYVKRLSSKVANKIRRSVLNDNVPDTGCGLKVMYTKAYLALPFFDHQHRFLPALFIRSGGKVEVVPVNHRPRNEGQSKYGISNRLWVGIIDMFGVKWLCNRAKNPNYSVIQMKDM